jgi:hypothetical protein
MSERDKPQKLSRDDVFSELARVGAIRAVVEFSGGNDEGGPDRVRLFTADGELTDLTVCAQPNEPTPQEAAEEKLADALSEPIYDRYHTFAGDFEVAGELIWDVIDRTVQMVKDEREDWDHSEEYV